MTQFIVNERFKWVGSGNTTREKDWAYCLLRLFDSYMRLRYGEAKENAVRRLRKEIETAGDTETRDIS
jgi:hypothetical protein